MKIFPAVNARPVRNAFNALSLLLVLCIAATPECVAQTVEFVDVIKEIRYVQTSATDVIVDPRPLEPNYGGPYRFSLNVNGQNLGGITVPTFTGPVNIAAVGSWYNNGKLVYDPKEGAWKAGSGGNN